MTGDYRNTFGKEMPHPKMDALVESLQAAWTTGKKSLVFVRRVKSVDELKRKLDESTTSGCSGTCGSELPDWRRA